MSGPTARARLDGKRPRRGRPRHAPAAARTARPAPRRRVVGVEGEHDGDGRVLAGPVGVVLAGLEVRQRRLALPAVGEDPLALVEEPLVPQRLERPHDALHVGEVHGLVVVGEVHPPGLAGDVALPGVGGALHQGPAVVVEVVDAVLDDAGPPRHLELLLGRHLGGQAVAVPPEAALHPPAPHRLVPGHGVLHEAGEEVPVVGEPVGERGPVVEDELVVPPRPGPRRRPRRCRPWPSTRGPAPRDGGSRPAGRRRGTAPGRRRVGHASSVLERVGVPAAACPRRPEYRPGRRRCCRPGVATLWSPTFVEPDESQGR